MARRAPVKSRPAPPRTNTTRRRPPTRARRAAPPKPTPLITPDQRRELVGIGVIGLGVVLACALALPDGGTITSGLHDALFRSLGVGAWLMPIALMVTGGRTCGQRQWKGGMAALGGSLLSVFALMGLLGLLTPGSAGAVGSGVSSFFEHHLGGAAAAMALLVFTCIGLVLAIDLRVAVIANAAHAWWVSQREREAQLAAIGAEPLLKERRRRDEAELKGKKVAKPVLSKVLPVMDEETLFPEVTPLSSLVDDEPPIEEPIPEAFSREFENVAVEPGLGTIPEIDLAHAPEKVEEEVEKVWVLPSTDLLDIVVGKRERLAAEVELTKQKIVATLKSFGIETRIIGASSGPTVTQYELQPAAGVPVRKIVSYTTDLSLALAAPIRIQPFIAGKSAIGIEVPNKAAQLVSLRDVVATPAFTETRSRLSVALGADVSGHPVVGDLTRMPHMLIAGSTGSGKSVCINALLAGFLLQATPAQLKLILIDPKRVEMNNYADIPHLLVPVVVEPEAAVASLRWAVKEMEERYKLFASHGARNIAAFNERAPSLGLAALPYTVIVIDELADLMMVAAGEIEDLICRIAQLARAVGIHLIVATQRPSADIITGLIKANIPSRVAFAVSSGVDSRVILDEMGAEKLLGRGDMLYLPIDEGKPRRLQGAFVSDRELDALIGHWKAQGLPDYQEEIFQVESTHSWAREAGKRDPLFAKAAHVVAAEGRAAASLLQRKLGIGYTRAARLVDQLADHRVIGPYEGSKSREVLLDVIQVDELLADLGEEER